MKEIVRERHRVGRHEGVGNGGEEEGEGLDVFLFQQVQGVRADEVHGTGAAGEDVGEGGRGGARGVVLLKLPVYSTQDVVHHDRHQVRTELHHQRNILQSTVAGGGGGGLEGKGRDNETW